MLTHHWMSGCLVYVAVLGSVAVAAPAAAFPPPKAAPHTAVYKMTSQATRDGKSETKKDTVTIAVLGSKSSWKDGAGQVTIYDAQAKKMIVYGGKSKEKVAHQKAIPSANARWELGYQSLATSMVSPPKETGKAKHGGESCTLIQFDTSEFGKPELCVTDKGVVARYAERRADGSETIYEADKITMSAPGRDAFEIPSEFELKD